MYNPDTPSSHQLFFLTGFIACHTIFVFLPVTSRKKREDESALRQIEKNILGEMLGKQQSAFPAAGWTQVEALARERAGRPRRKESCPHSGSVHERCKFETIGCILFLMFLAKEL